MRIVYSLDTLSIIGGIERVTVVKANALSAVAGNEVYIVVSNNWHKDVQFELSPSVQLIDLGADDCQADYVEPTSVLARQYQARKQRKLRKKQIAGLLDEISPDIVVSVGNGDRDALVSLKTDKWKLVREIHTERNHFVQHATSFIEKLKVRIKRYYDEQYNMRKADKVVLLTSAELNTVWSKRHNFAVIPNPLSFKCDTPSNLNEKKVISMGRLDSLKNFSSLINVFKLVSEKHSDWRLEIYGDGAERASLQRQIEQSGLAGQVFLKGFTLHVLEELCRSSIFAMTSLSEGFGMVLLEAMECGLPVVAYDCPTGPSHIIDDGVNGYLVPMNEEQQMVERICNLIEDRELRESMGHRAREKAKDYQIEPIVDRWMQLFRGL